MDEMYEKLRIIIHREDGSVLEGVVNQKGRQAYTSFHCVTYPDIGERWSVTLDGTFHAMEAKSGKD